MIVFTHIPKTGGSPVREWFIEKLGREKVFWHREPGNPEGFGGVRQVPEKRRIEYFQQFEMIGGHFGFWEPTIRELEDAGITVCRACLLREPFERVVSHFDFVAQRPHHGSYTSKSFGEALRIYDEVFRRNQSQQNRYVSGASGFEATRKFLIGVPCMIGTLETKNDYLTQLSKACPGLGDPNSFPAANGGRRGYRRRYDRYRTDSRLRQIIAEDEKLYRWVMEEYSGLLVQ